MPDGQRETSPRSSASNSPALIFVLAEIEDSAICRRSRSRRRRTHSDSGDNGVSIWSTVRALCAILSPAGLRANRVPSASIDYTHGRNCSVSVTLFTSGGGTLVLPDRSSLLVSRENGGNLVVNPPRRGGERSEVTPAELPAFAFLVAAAARAMIDGLPQLQGGCINYWEAGNWALNDQAEPKGRKEARSHRQMHLHLLGRSPAAVDPAWAWGESPVFPRFADRASWAASFERLTAAECRQVVSRADDLLRTTYGPSAGPLGPWSLCADCAYPAPLSPGGLASWCSECESSPGSEPVLADSVTANPTTINAEPAVLA